MVKLNQYREHYVTHSTSFAFCSHLQENCIFFFSFINMELFVCLFLEKVDSLLCGFGYNRDDLFKAAQDEDTEEVQKLLDCGVKDLRRNIFLHIYFILSWVFLSFYGMSGIHSGGAKSLHQIFHLTIFFSPTNLHLAISNIPPFHKNKNYCDYILTAGCSLNIVFFQRFSRLPLGVSVWNGTNSYIVCVHNGSATAELAELRKITTF